MHKRKREKRSENRKNVSICCRGGACPSRRYTADSHRPPSKRRWPPTGSVAVFPERPVGDIQPQKCSGAPLHRPDVSLRGGRRPTWQSREGTHDFADRFPTIQSGAARLHPKGTSSRFALRAPRRFAPRNDKPLAFTILSTAVPQRKKSGMPDFPASPIGSLTYRTVPWRGRGGRPRSGSSAAPRGLRCRWSRRRSCRRSYPHRRAPWQPRSACRASAP